MRSILALTVFRALNRSVWLNELVGGKEREGRTLKTSRDGFSPSYAMVLMMDLMARRRICGSGIQE